MRLTSVGLLLQKLWALKKISVSFCHWQPFGLRRGKLTLVAFVWLFSTMHFQMSPQVACTRRGIITLVAFVWLFSTVHFQMSPQIACLRGWKLTLVAFVWLFSTVHFQMSPQIACLRGWKLTLVAWLRRNYNKITVCQKANCITKSAFSAFFRLFPPFRLFHPISLLDCAALTNNCSGKIWFENLNSEMGWEWKAKFYPVISSCES